MSRIIKKGKTALASSILNILGLTAAFAALYIILVQVHHDLTYTRRSRTAIESIAFPAKERFLVIMLIKHG